LHPYSKMTCISSWYICKPNIIWIYLTIIEKMNGLSLSRVWRTDGRRTGRTSPYHNTSRFQRAYKNCHLVTDQSVIFFFFGELRFRS
jgi:hypothetical protein